MEHAITIKTMASSIAAMLSAIILALFQIPPEAFITAIVGSVIGEFMRGKADFKSAFLTITAVTIVTAWLGKWAIVAFNDLSPTSVCGLLATLITWQRDKVMEKGAMAIDTAFDWFFGFFKR